MKKMFIPFSLPSLGNEELEEVADTLKSGWLTTGPKTKKFETDFADYIGCKHAVAVNSCTAALHLALDAIGVGPDDYVITTPMTFAATAEVIRYFGAKPVFVDVEEGTMNIDPDLLEKLLKGMRADEIAKVKAVMPVHMAGQPCRMDEIMHIAKTYGLKVVEDAAHTLPARYKGRMVGTIGDITAFSFYATKCITTGEGGMVSTDNEEYAERMRVMSLHGISKAAWKRYTAEGSWYYEINYPGFKYNMADIVSAVGIQQLKKADRLLEIRRRHAEAYNSAFSGMPGVELPEIIPEVEHSWHLYVIKLELEKLMIDRAAFIEELRKKGIYASVHFIPLHMHPYYRNTYGYRPEDYPVAAGLYERIVSLPFYPKMTDDELRYVMGSVIETLEDNLVAGGTQGSLGVAA
ncbi:MAG TPA: DegT/DnrJ/EryC1/StrS family aminotransferase [Nitrospirota bacterium]|jgi:dTDP-4-amino-4,6-dideoxygalactose transaminase